MEHTNRLEVFNKADQLVCLLAVVFLVTLVLKCKFKDVLALEWLYFCSEAALVGGVADWFAVTALFKRPLGFKFHTDLIHSNKEALAKGCATLVQQELLDKDSLKEKIHSLDMTGTMLAKLNEPHMQMCLKQLLVEYAEKQLQSVDTAAAAAAMEKLIREQMNTINLPGKATLWLREKFQQGLNEKIYDVLTDKLYAYVQEPATQDLLYQEIEQRVEAYKAEHPLASAFSGIFSFFGAKPIFDTEDMTNAAVTELTKTVADLQDYAPLRHWFLAQLDAALEGVLTNTQWQNILLGLQKDILLGLSIQGKIKQLLEEIIASACRPQNTSGNELVVPSILTKVVDSGLELILTTLNTSPVYQERLENFLQKTALAGVNMAHNTLGEVVETILVGMNDKKLNDLIYSKVEEDMLWIRFNGSIVGAIIGCVVFGILQVVSW